VLGTENYAEYLLEQANALRQAMNSTPGAPESLRRAADRTIAELDGILNVKFNRRTNRPSEEENPPAQVPLKSRLGKLTWIAWSSTQEPTQGQRDAYRILEKEFPPVYNEVKRIGEQDIPGIRAQLELLKAPATPGLLPK
jgi:hypothetical protein